METVGVLFYKKIPVRLKEKFYGMMVRLALLYGSECWLVKKSQIQKMKVEEMMMLRQICGHTRLDRIRNKVIREKWELHLSRTRCER